ncbi:uncharacterized protein LOC117108647 [Anneissia japonica]|uniref:uncharacterized protein LOC117108647 n=1 Tax=Anneissia japonica TaxID=1529436 RepID=UPI00142585E9|nr:uncharacterized protein LOC117108647 [Anneissia japonica]
MLSQVDNMALLPVMKPCGMPTIFGELEEKNVTFLINTSSSMFVYLNIVKKHLTEVLLARAYGQINAKFNIMAVATEITPWADKLVQCTPQTVTLAAEWIKNLTCKTGSNMKDAFIAAYADSSCDSIYLITDRLPDQCSQEVVYLAELRSNGRPVHVILFADSEPDLFDVGLLEQLAIQTDGTLHLICVSRNGRVDSVKPIISADNRLARTTTSILQQPLVETVTTTMLNSPVHNVRTYLNEDSIPNTSITTMLDNFSEVNTTTFVAGVVETKSQKVCNVPSSLDNQPIMAQVVYLKEPANTFNTRSQYILPDLTWDSHSSHVHPIVYDLDEDFSPIAGTLLNGAQVLARRDRDGYYYMGVVKQQVTVNGYFLIAFNEHPVGTRSTKNRFQETAIVDIIKHDDGLRHPILPGDNVLAPCDKDGVCYAPGTVLEGTEGRFARGTADTNNLVVRFFNGTTIKIPKQTAVWLQKEHYDRIKLGIQMPLFARQSLENDPHYPFQALSGYTTSLPVKSNHTLTSDYAKIPLHRRSTGNSPYCHTSVKESVVKSEDIDQIIPGTTMTKDELNDKVIKQLIDHKMVIQDKTRLLNREPWGKKSVSFRRGNELENDVCFAQGSESGVEKSNELGHEYDRKNFEEVRMSRVVTTETQTLPLPGLSVRTDSIPLSQHSLSGMKLKSNKSLNSNDVKYSNDHDSLEARVQPYMKDAPNGLVNGSNHFIKSVDASIRSDRARMEWEMKHPHPPPPPSQLKVTPSQALWTQFANKDLAREAKEQSFIEYRRKQVTNREESWNDKKQENEQMKAAKAEQYRKYTADVIRRDIARQNDNEQKLRNVQEAKRAASASIAKQQQENAERHVDKERLRIQAISQQKQRREDIKMQRQYEIEETMARRRAIKQQLTQRKWEEHSTNMKEKHDQEVARDKMMRSKQMAIRHRFQDIEHANQQKKDLRLQVREQSRHELRSQVLP